MGEYLTYLSPFSYQVGADGSMTPINDTAMLAAARNSRVAPLLVLTNFAKGNFSTEIVDTILKSTAVQDTLIENMIRTMRDKGYYGVNIDFERISPVITSYSIHYTKLYEAAPKTGWSESSQ